MRRGLVGMKAISAGAFASLWLLLIWTKRNVSWRGAWVRIPKWFMKRRNDSGTRFGRTFVKDGRRNIPMQIAPTGDCTRRYIGKYTSSRPSRHTYDRRRPHLPRTALIPLGLKAKGKANAQP